MKVKIKENISRDHWYRDDIGKIFEISEVKKSSIYAMDIYVIKNGYKKGIYENDCDIFLEKNEYPTIKESYF